MTLYVDRVGEHKFSSQHCTDFDVFMNVLLPEATSCPGFEELWVVPFRIHNVNLLIGSFGISHMLTGTQNVFLGSTGIPTSFHLLRLVSNLEVLGCPKYSTWTWIQRRGCHISQPPPECCHELSTDCSASIAETRKHFFI